MTISKQIVADFLDRELDDFAFLKEWRRKDLLTELRALPVRPRITSPHKHWHHQLVGLLLLCLFDGFLLFLDLGSGKTRILLEAFAYRRRRKQAKRMLAVSLNDVNAWEWEDQAAIHAPQLRIEVLVGSYDERWKAFDESDADIFSISYPGLRIMCSKKKKSGNGKYKMFLDPAKVKRLTRRIDFVVYDEIHKCKNIHSLSYKVCRAISKTVKFRYGSTGTAFGRNQEDLWAEFFLCDRGETLGTTIGLFREAYFVETRGFGGWKVWKFDKRTKLEFQQALKHRSIYYRDTEIGDMPKRVRRVHKLRPPQSLQDFYNSALESLQIATKNDELKNNWIRLRMICSGFIAYRDEDNGKVQIALPENPKLETLEAFVDQVPLDWRGIIVHEFVYSGLIIEQKLTEMGVEFLCLNGRTKSRDKKEVRKAFRTDPKAPRFLIMNWRSGGTGGNYQCAPYMHFYETPVSSIERKQTEGRIRRRDNTARRVYYSDSIIAGSIEEDILGYLKEGRDMYTDLMSDNRAVKQIRKL